VGLRVSASQEHFDNMIARKESELLCTKVFGRRHDMTMKAAETQVANKE